MKTSNLLYSAIILSLLFVFSHSNSQTPGSILDWTKICSTNGVPSLLNDSYFGVDCDTIGDLNNDGVMDLVVGAAKTNSYQGQIQILFMNANKTVKYSKILSSTSGNLNISTSLVGNSICNIGDFNHDGTNDIAIGCENDNKVYIAMLDTNGTVKNTIDIGGNYTGYFGCDILKLGDIDNDGVVDLAVSAYNNGIYIIKLNANGSIKTSSLLTNYSSIGYIMTENFPGSMTFIDDLDGNGAKEIVVGAANANNGKGEIVILYMYPNYTLKSYSKIGSNSINFTTLNNDDWFGIRIQNVGDINNDGVKDILVGAHGDDDGGLSSNNYGAVYAICLNVNGTVKSYYKIGHSSESFFHILSTGDMFGLGISILGDINNDLKLDFIVGAIGDDAGGTDRGAVYIFTISSLMNAIKTNKIADDNVIIYPSPTTGIVNIQSYNVDGVDIFDISGRLIKYEKCLNDQEGNIKLDLTHLAKGLYYIGIKKHNSIFIKKIIIN